MCSNFGIIYKITNNVNKKVYVGQTWQTINARFNAHKREKHGKCIKLFNAFNKYGRDNFTIEPLIMAHSQDVMDHWEVYFIKKYSSICNGYNCRVGGSRGQFSQQSINRMSVAQTGKVIPPNVRNKISKAHMGKILSTKTKRKIGDANRGRKLGPLSDETKKKQSAALTGRVFSSQQKEKYRQAAYKRKAKVSLEDADNMLKLKSDGVSTKEIAMMYDISESYARGILNGSRRNKQNIIKSRRDK